MPGRARSTCFDELLNRTPRSELWLNLHVQAKPQHVEQFKIQRIVHDDAQSPVRLRHRQNLVLLYQVFGDEL